MAGVRPAASATVVASRPRSPSRYFLLVFGWSWLWWAVVASAGVPVTQPQASLMFLVGGLGPSGAALALVLRHYSAADRRDFWRRIWDPRRIGGKWWLVIVAAGAGPTVVGWLFTSGGDLTFSVSSTGAVEVGVVAWLMFAAGAALVEEPGWRGYALDSLLRRYSLIRTSLVLGVAWMAWHLPQFFIEGTYQHDELGFGTAPFWMFAAAIVAQTFHYVWILTNTSMSILAAVVFHALTNLAGEILDPGLSGRMIALVLWVLAAVALGIYWRGRPRPSEGLSAGERTISEADLCR